MWRPYFTKKGADRVINLVSSDFIKFLVIFFILSVSIFTMYDYLPEVRFEVSKKLRYEKNEQDFLKLLHLHQFDSLYLFHYFMIYYH
jgi:hypothetical protein